MDKEAAATHMAALYRGAHARMRLRKQKELIVTQDQTAKERDLRAQIKSFELFPLEAPDGSHRLAGDGSTGRSPRPPSGSRRRVKNRD